MLLPRFDYHRPSTLHEALEIIDSLGPQAKLLAGGTDLLVNMKHGKLSPPNVVGLEALDELKSWENQGDQVHLGPCLSAARLAAAMQGGELPAALAKGAGVLGSPQVRNRATVGGNVVTARPAADMCVPLLALGAFVELQGVKGSREVDMSSFFLGPGETVIGSNEMLTKIMVPVPAAGSGSGYSKLGLRQALEISLVNAAAWIRLTGDGKSIAQGRVALGAVAPTPLLSPGAAKALEGAPLERQTFEAAAQAAMADCRPITDHRGSAGYRRDMVRELTIRALEQAAQQAQGN